MELYGERGFDQTTVAEIAARAGLTERTFFRYFADKREVLFWGSAALQKLLVDAVTGAPGSTAPIDAVAAALDAVVPMFQERRNFARRRHTLIVAHPELQERELIKLASLASAMADALRRRGVTEPAASLTAEAGVAVFKISFERWVSDPKRRDPLRTPRPENRSTNSKRVAAGRKGAIARPGPPTSRRASAPRAKAPTRRPPR